MTSPPSPDLQSRGFDPELEIVCCASCPETRRIDIPGSQPKTSKDFFEQIPKARWRTGPKFGTWPEAGNHPSQPGSHLTVANDCKLVVPHVAAVLRPKDDGQRKLSRRQARNSRYHHQLSGESQQLSRPEEPIEPPKTRWLPSQWCCRLQAGRP